MDANKEITTITVTPEDADNVVDIIKSYIVFIASACGRPKDQITAENIIITLNALHPGLLEACFKQTHYKDMQKMVEAASKHLTSKNVVSTFSTNSFVSRPLAIAPAMNISTSKFKENRIFNVYKNLYKIMFDTNFDNIHTNGVNYKKILQWYFRMYKKELTLAVLAEEFNLDPETHKTFRSILKKSGIFYILQRRKPLIIQAYGPIRAQLFAKNSERIAQSNASGNK